MTKCVKENKMSCIYVVVLSIQCTFIIDEIIIKNLNSLLPT